MLRYRDMTDEQKAKKKARVSQSIRNHPEKHRERIRKHRTEHPEECREYKRRRRAEHREEVNERKRKKYAENRELYRERRRNDLNSSGKTKGNIRAQSRHYLYDKHSKLEGYEIHHCFGYGDYRKFIYIPKDLHLQIHQLLRDNKIPVDTDHWTVIRDLVNSCDQYTYISV